MFVLIASLRPDDRCNVSSRSAESVTGEPFKIWYCSRSTIESSSFNSTLSDRRFLLPSYCSSFHRRPFQSLRVYMFFFLWKAEIFPRFTASFSTSLAKKLYATSSNNNNSASGNRITNRKKSPVGFPYICVSQQTASITRTGSLFLSILPQLKRNKNWPGIWNILDSLFHMHTHNIP